jgi:hypothetical protein
MKYLKSINELFRSLSFNNNIATPFSGTSNSPISRFMEYEAGNKSGWRLVGMRPVDEYGNPARNKSGMESMEIPIKRFTVDNNADYALMKKVIIAALGEIGNLPWIEDYNFPGNKAYATIYLAKLAMEFNGKLYAPVFEYPSLNKFGDSFWIGTMLDAKYVDVRDSEEMTTKKEKELVMSAKTIVILPDDVSDAEIKKASLAQLNSSIYNRWLMECEERKKENLPLRKEPKPINPLVYDTQHAIIRETGEKNFFVIYKQNSKEDPINFVLRTIGKKNITSELTRKSVSSDYETKRASSGKFFNLAPTESKLKKFYYLPAKGNENVDLIPLKEGNYVGFTPLEIISVFPPKIKNQVFREVSVMLLRGPKIGKPTTIKLMSGDKVFVPRLYSGETLYNEAEITRIDFEDKKRVPVRWIEK